MFNVWQFVDRGEAMHRLRAMLSPLLNGSEVDLRTPLVRKLDPVLGRSDVAAQVWKECDLSSLPLWLRECEDVQRRKIGTYSRFGPYETTLAESVEKYFTDHPCRLDRKAASLADESVGRLLDRGRNRLELVPLDQAAVMFDGRSGLGWPVFSSNPSFYGVVQEMSSLVLGSLASEMAGSFPAVLGVRGQPTGMYDAKVRAIFQCSRVIGNLEKMIQVPVLRAMRHCSPFAAWNGRVDVDYSITRMFQQGNNCALSLDFSSFDSSIPNEVLMRQFAILEKWFTPSAIPLIRFIAKTFMRTGIAVPKRGGTHSLLPGTNRCGGIPSGSVLTNLVGSMVNIWAMSYASERSGVAFTDLLVQGDDGVYSYPFNVDMNALSQVLLEDLGMVMHVDKNFIASGEVHFLQNIHRKSLFRRGLNVGIRPIMRVLNGMLSYERFTPGWNGYLDSIRWIQQLDNCYTHPCFESFVGWLMAKDRNLNMPIADIIESAGGMGYVIAKLGAAPMGSNKTPIQDIATSIAANKINDINNGVMSSRFSSFS